MVQSLVTGANRGIGLELVKQLKAMQHRVTAVCRTSSAALDALGLGVDVVSGVDVSSAAAAAQLARAGDSPLDWLIANAGVLQPDSLTHLDFEAARRQFEVNALGTLRTVSALLPRLRSGSKVALITSRMGSIADNSSGNFYGYRMSKAALNAAGMSLARDLKPRGIAVAILHPGYVKTDMTAMAGGTPPSDAAAQLIARIQACTLETSGTFWHANGEVLPW
jgi:NAD(P)-dependent dehydrogenase (short-subunit alcohol dehydrogenase family)